MNLFFEPRTVALIGASGNAMRPGHHLFLNLQDSMGDNFYPINPRMKTIGSRVCYPDILSVPSEIDVAIIFIPANSVPEAIEQCAQKGIGRIIIESAGFAEAGPEGKALQERCLEIARSSGIRLWGPNCMGMINVRQMKVLSFMIPFIWKGQFLPGRVSLVVQSGMLSAGFLMHTLSRTPFGLSKVCSIGNKMDVDEVDILEYLISDPQTGVIGMYLETMKRGRRFFNLARSTDKPIVILKSGRSSPGFQAAVSHTASLAQDDRVLDSALKQAKVIRVKGLNELMDVSRCLGVSEAKPAFRSRLAVFSFSGGAGVVTSDDVADYGMELAELAPSTLAKIKKVFPEWMEPSNPVDLYPAIEKNGPTVTVRETFAAVMEDPNVDAVYAHLFAPPISVPLFDYDHMTGLIKKHNKPLVVWIMGHLDGAVVITKELEKRGIPVVDDIARGVRILAALTKRR